MDQWVDHGWTPQEKVSFPDNLQVCKKTVKALTVYYTAARSILHIHLHVMYLQLYGTVLGPLPDPPIASMLRRPSRPSPRLIVTGVPGELRSGAPHHLPDVTYVVYGSNPVRTRVPSENGVRAQINHKKKKKPKIKKKPTPNFAVCS